MIVKRPVLTEKTLNLYKSDKKVTFEVDVKTNKVAARNAVEKAYGVKIGDVSVTNRLGKFKTSRISKKLSKLADKKIMVFKLVDGKIDLFESKE